MINAEIERGEGESAINTIRRFSRRVQGAGIIQRMRKHRYYTRIKSREVRRKHTLKVIARRENMQELIKLGKVIEQKPRGRR